MKTGKLQPRVANAGVSKPPRSAAPPSPKSPAPSAAGGWKPASASPGGWKPASASRGLAGNRPAVDPPGGTQAGPAAKRQRTYGEGTHGYKKTEQARLSQKYGAPVTGATHESEHAVGYDVLAKQSGLNRKTDGAGLEKMAPAYQEQKEFHRAHIGTGNRASVGPEGFTSASYRDDQRKLIQAGDVSSAVQLNQLGYAHNPSFQSGPNSAARRQADDSFKKMVGANDSLTYAGQGGQHTTVPIDARQKAEMSLSRPAAQTGKFPTVAEENAARQQFGLPPVKE